MYISLERRRPSASFLAAILCLFGVVSRAIVGQAATVTYSLLSAQSYLTLTGTVTSADIRIQPQSPGANTAHLAGSIVGDLSGNSITFSGTSSIVAQQNPDGFFAPAPNPPLANRVDNMGLQGTLLGGLVLAFQAALRNAEATITSGTATFNTLSTVDIGFTSGQLDYIDHLNGTQNQLNLTSFSPGSSTGTIERTISGGSDTITIPVSFTDQFSVAAPSDSTVTITGQIVADRPAIIPGDFNQDDHVNAADILAMESALTNVSAYESAHNLTSAEFTTLGDLNGDGQVNNADLQALLTLLKSGGGSTGAVPEPSSLLLLAFGGFALVVRRRIDPKARR